MMFTSWVIVGSRVGTGFLGSDGGFGGSMFSNGDGGSSWLYSILDCVTDNGRDSESEEAVGDDMAVVDGTMVSVCGCTVKQPLE